jgi:GNAT superfamily N-acetyltransferase
VTAASLSVISRAERDSALAVLVLAFGSDPVERFLYPEPDRYLADFPTFLGAFGGEAFTAGTAWSVEPGAVALWLPPGRQPDGPAVVGVLSRSVEPGRLADVFSVLEDMEAHHPRFPHWYLPWFGVDPVQQGRGLGTRLLRSCLERVDADHVPAYLETPNPRNIPFYERQGFVTTGSAQAGACPPVTFMLRAAR